MYNGKLNTFTSKGNFNTGDKLSVNVNYDNSELIAVIAKPKSSGLPFWFKVEHKGTADFEIPWFVYMIIGLIIFGGIFCGVFVLSFVA